MAVDNIKLDDIIIFRYDAIPDGIREFISIGNSDIWFDCSLKRIYAGGVDYTGVTDEDKLIDTPSMNTSMSWWSSRYDTSVLTVNSGKCIQNYLSMGFVHKTDNIQETITGKKIFNDVIYLADNGNSDDVRPEGSITAKTGIQGTMAGIDRWSIMGYGTGDDIGYLEVAVGKTGNEPVYVSQYQGDPLIEGAVRTHDITLMDGNGDQLFNNTTVRGNLYTTENLTVKQNTSVYGWVNVAGDVSITGSLNTTRNTSVRGNSDVYGNTSSGGFVQSRALLTLNAGMPWGLYNDGNYGGRLYANGVAFRPLATGNDSGGMVFNEPTTDTGSMEIYTSDNGNEPIYVKQYLGTAGTPAHQITLMNADGNQVFNATTVSGLLQVNRNTGPVGVFNNTVSGGEPFIYLQQAGANKAAFTYHATHGSALYEATSAKYLGIKSDGTPHYQGNELLHSANYTNYALSRNGGSMNNTNVVTNLNADLLDGIHANGFARAYSSSYSFGGSNTEISTATFITLLNSLGAFNQPYWIAKGSWAYSNNYIINDTGLGNIQLAGAVVEVMGNASTYTIRITTSPAATNGGVTNSVFIYRNHGDGYSPNWKRLVNTTDTISNATNAVNATNAGNADTVDGKHNGDLTAENLKNNGTTPIISGTTMITSGLRLYQVYNNGYPCTYGNLLRIGGSGHGEMVFQWTGDSTLGRLYYRSKRDNEGGNWSGWGTIAYVSDNVASATQLQNTRTIWGQNFNGTGNVTGNMTGVGNINTKESPIGTVYANNWYRSTGNTGWYHETYGGGIYMTDTTWIRTYGSKNFYHNTGIFRTDGTLQVGENGDRFLVQTGGNVGIGTTSPSYKLHVAGTGYFTGYVDFVGGAGNSGSDMRFKENIKPLPNILKQINELDIFSYEWVKPGERTRDTFGVNAEQLEGMGGPFAKMVHERDDEEKTKFVEYDRTGVLALKGVQELYKEVLRLREELEEMKKKQG